ncbi:MAG: rod shape-determining protein MreC [Bacteroidales bacterium]|nr:rod shape-determining protein MreC [Bacteroidales bacterium]MDE6802986.1 rod shape-determining protein MreC [Muribaculaceae bacterium]
MRTLLNFLVKHQAWFLFIFYVVISLGLLFNNSPYQRHVYLTSASRVTGSVYRMSNSVTGYFNLRAINDDLQRQNAELSSELLALRDRVDALSLRLYADSITEVEPARKYDFILAKVINNSISHPHNYITIDKGALDGIHPEMGVIDQNGVIGVVEIVNDRFARIISLLNPDFRLSCKVKGNEVIGSMVWDGKDSRTALVEELPKHTVFAPGDTIVTSGYSAMFPPDIPVATIIERATTNDDNFYTLRVRLLTEFAQLSTVRVIINSDLDELREIEAGKKE